MPLPRPVGLTTTSAPAGLPVDLSVSSAVCRIMAAADSSTTARRRRPPTPGVLQRAVGAGGGQPLVDQPHRAPGARPGARRARRRTRGPRRPRAPRCPSRLTGSPTTTSTASCSTASSTSRSRSPVPRGTVSSGTASRPSGSLTRDPDPDGPDVDAEPASRPHVASAARTCATGVGEVGGRPAPRALGDVVAAAALAGQRPGQRRHHRAGAGARARLRPRRPRRPGRSGRRRRARPSTTTVGPGRLRAPAHVQGQGPRVGGPYPGGQQLRDQAEPVGAGHRLPGGGDLAGLGQHLVRRGPCRARARRRAAGSAARRPARAAPRAAPSAPRPAGATSRCSRARNR